MKTDSAVMSIYLIFLIIPWNSSLQCEKLCRSLTLSGTVLITIAPEYVNPVPHDRGPVWHQLPRQEDVRKKKTWEKRKIWNKLNPKDSIPRIFQKIIRKKWRICTVTFLLSPVVVENSSNSCSMLSSFDCVVGIYYKMIYGIFLWWEKGPTSGRVGHNNYPCKPCRK